MARGIPSQVIRHFQAIPLFSSLSKRAVRSVVQAATEVDVRAGKVLVREGDHGREMYVVISGTAVVTQKGRKVAELVPGDFFGEMAFLSPAPRSATVAAYSDMRLMVLGPREMDVIVKAEPAIAGRLLQAMALRIRRSQKSLTH
jgi:CRP/FNR family cyclic AMP-dependent transcriptional regulator